MKHPNQEGITTFRTRTQVLSRTESMAMITAAAVVVIVFAAIWMGQLL